MPILIAQDFKHSNQRVQLPHQGGEGLCGFESGGGCLGNGNGAFCDARKQIQKPYATEESGLLWAKNVVLRSGIVRVTVRR